LRPAQATLGALILACKEDATQFSALSPAVFAELGSAVGAIEAGLESTFDFKTLNYLMLMMVDPYVHFHVLPRYAGEQKFGEACFEDPGWPCPPNVAHANDVDDATMANLLATLKSANAGAAE